VKENQFSLLKKRRFAPLFITQLCGAFNDNVYKNALIILITFQLVAQSAFSTDVWVNMAAAFFIVPFFLFSATFGQLADKLEKSRLIRLTKILEIFIMLIAVAAFYTGNIGLLMLTLFLLGTQSALFGPVKYSILPQALSTQELVGGNALIGSGTFVAILTGTLCGGFLISAGEHGKLYVSVLMLSVAVLGFLASLLIPKANIGSPKLKINWHLFSATLNNLRLARQNRTVFLSVLGVSWFWFYGSLFFYQAPNYVKKVLGGGPHMVTVLITVFAIGIGVGSLLCERLSRRRIEIGLVPIGAIGLSLFSLLLFFIQPSDMTIQQTLPQFLSHFHSWLLLFCLFLLAVSGGIYSVPLYALIQDRSEPQSLSRIVAANNILNALFMVAAALFAIVFLSIGMTIPHLFLITAILNVGVASFIFLSVPEFFIRFIVWIIAHFLYHIEVKGREHLPEKGAAILVCNHVSFVDGIIMSAVSKRPIRFLLDYQLFNSPILGRISRLAKAIPIATGKEDQKIKKQALYRAVEALHDQEIVGLFPEGFITRDGHLGELKYGVIQLAQQSHAVVIPMAIQGLWGSFFSRRYGRAMSHWPKRFYRTTIGLNIGKPIPAAECTLEKIREAIMALHNETLNEKIAVEDASSQKK
jgi:1-acyl-sn-glycerol-3-phosphate acyltransferase